MQLNQSKHKLSLPQFQFAALTHENQIKPLHNLDEDEAVFSSQKDDCHAILPDFGEDQFFICSDHNG